MDVQVQDLSWVGDRFGQWAQWSGLIQGPVRPMPVVKRLELAQGVQQMGWSQMRVRSSSSRRQVCIQRSIMEFIRGIRTPLLTTSNAARRMSQH
jgi:hypothetical protein